MNKNIAVVILAAGKGTRMKSSFPKVLHPVLGKAMINYVVESALKLKPFEIIPVLSHQKELVEKHLTDDFGFIFKFAHQKTPLGTGDAVRWAVKHLSENIDTVLILSGDVPLITPELLNNLMNNHRSPVTITTLELENPAGYGRIIRDNKGNILKIVEEKNASEAEKSVKEVNAGLYCFDKTFLLKHIEKLTPNELTKEYYLTEIIDMAVSEGTPISCYTEKEGWRLLGINSRIELATATKYLQDTILKNHMDSGVTIINPERVYIEKDVLIGEDTVIYPDCHISGITKIGKNATIEQGVIIKDSIIHDNVHIKPYCVIENSEIFSNTVIGPFAHLRPETILEEKVKIGNFVETKKARFKKGAKANHLSYIGDALVEENTNIGAGTITCNYDGEKKHFTHIKKNAFIGSNTCLVAPVTIGESAVTGAGSVITKDVPDNSLAVERSEQRIIENWHKIKKRIKK
ncbi:MAG: bifunctional UDP-N-acetylglucosamine diphosphorylase/glucosamine-1-phosphate N-acetyltransferase GlmU [Proteobacteria bacterium]|nr:bifunctional UDP-N-acetylglucosamine diphosphorylase/glucosamine-1-phosphate N-acetyltransferase GlmU [Pseudomonadota bacterium]